MWRIIEDIFIKFPILPLYALTWVVGVFFFKKYFDTAIRHLPLFIGYTFLTELLGFLVKNYSEFTFYTDPQHDWHNIIIYNIYGVLTLFYFAWVYLKLIKRRKLQLLIKGGVILYAISYIITLVYRDPEHEVFLVPSMINGFVISTAAFCHIWELKQKPGSSPPHYNLMFWVDRGLIAFNLPFPFLYFILFNHYREIFQPYRLDIVFDLSIAAMYIIFIIGFIRASRPAFR